MHHAPAVAPSLPAALIADLEAAVGPAHVLLAPEELLLYETDALPLFRRMPGAVVLPGSVAEVQAVVRACSRAAVPFVARGAGTGLSGGALANDGGVVVVLTRLHRIVALDPASRLAWVEPGVVNLDLSRAANEHGLHFAPDPSSQQACTVGGNVAENAGGPHCLKYGATLQHVVALEVVLPDGRFLRLGTETADAPGYDLVSLWTGSEGTFGIVTRALVRLTPLPAGVRTLLVSFHTVDDATAAVTTMVARGLVPAALEMMDGVILGALEEAFRVGLPTDAGAVLLVEVDGIAAGVDAAADRVEAVCREHRAREVRRARNDAERTALWRCRKLAFGAIGRVSPSYLTQDGVIPRTRLPETLRRIAEIGRRYGLRIANVFHAGDGNLHPCILFDERDEAQVERVHAAARDILRTCVDLGGSISGEHGVGLEKNEFMAWLFGEDDLAVQRELRTVFDPSGLANPGKIFPTQRCRW